MDTAVKTTPSFSIKTMPRNMVILLAGLLIIVVGLVVLFLMNLNNGNNNNVACTQEAKICPDGTAVGRTGPRCEFAECPSVNPSGASEVQMRNIDLKAGVSVVGGQTQDSFTVLNQAEYYNLMAKISNSTETRADLPAIDFTKEMLIVAFAGQKPSGGYSIEIQKITKNGKKLFVQIVTSKPGDSCINTMAMTTPYHVVAVPAGDFQIEFIPAEKVVDCESFPN